MLVLRLAWAQARLAISFKLTLTPSPGLGLWVIHRRGTALLLSFRVRVKPILLFYSLHPWFLLLFSSVHLFSHWLLPEGVADPGMRSLGP